MMETAETKPKARGKITFIIRAAMSNCPPFVELLPLDRFALKIKLAANAAWSTNLIVRTEVRGLANLLLAKIFVCHHSSHLTILKALL